MSKLVPALLAGCTIVVKPAPETPLDAYLMAELLEEAGIPKGVVNIVAAGREVGEHLVAPPRRRQGRLHRFDRRRPQHRRRSAASSSSASASSSAASRPRSSSTTPTSAATIEGLKFAALMNNGQACVAQTRILASRANYDEVVDALAEAVGGLQVGDPTDPATEIGPLVAQRQQERVEKYIALGQEEGARVVVGGNGMPDGLDRGWYVRPRCSPTSTTTCASPRRRSSARCSR